MTKSSKTKYKKAPQAPRRFKSAYMFFSTTKHKEIREELGAKGVAEKTTNIAKLVSQAWKELSTDERDKWEEIARKDKLRFEVEKSLYTGPWKVPAKSRSQKDPNAPKRPMSAFLAYSHARRSSVKIKNPGLNNAEISRLLAQMWKEAPEEDKKEHIEKEYLLRQKYLTEIAIWRENADRVIKEERRRREEFAMKTVAARGNSQEQVEAQHSSYDKDGSENMNYAGYYPASATQQFYGGNAPQASYGQDFRGGYSSYFPAASFPAASQHQQFDQPVASIRPPETTADSTYAAHGVDYYPPPNYGYYPPVAGAYPTDHQQYPANYGGGYGDYAPQAPNYGGLGFFDHQPYAQSQEDYDRSRMYSDPYQRSQTAHDYQPPPYGNYSDSNDSKPAARPTATNQHMPNHHLRQDDQADNERK
mmetsp:Transcript_1873/g.2283  ORF Transcript_1873/g.2283 Transcript_1873/m.2283 type:complete len:418 (-) Transcript_1873:444-1697(-)